MVTAGTSRQITTQFHSTISFERRRGMRGLAAAEIPRGGPLWFPLLVFSVCLAIVFGWVWGCTNGCPTLFVAALKC
jgi:hypothetical protein